MKSCRVCNSKNLIPWMDFEEQPLSNNFLTYAYSAYKKYPLKAVFCPECSLGQLTEVVPPEEMFTIYPFYAGLSKVWQEHCNDLVEQYASVTGYVIDIGSNDGCLLKCWGRAGIKAIGVDPCNLASPNTYRAFWGKEIAEKIVQEHGKACFITAQNVLAHINDVHDFFESVKIALAFGGRFLVEVPTLENLLRDVSFETIYHEHLSYFSEQALRTLFTSHGFNILSLTDTSSHGGSWRVVGSLEGKRTGLSPSEVISWITPLPLVGQIGEFQEKVDSFMDSFMLRTKVYGYGASAKATVLLNYFRRLYGRNLVEAIIDDTPFKQGRYIPGVSIPILSSAALRIDNPSYLYIFSWNNQKEIQEKAIEAGFKGEFI